MLRPKGLDPLSKANFRVRLAEELIGEVPAPPAPVTADRTHRLMTLEKNKKVRTGGWIQARQGQVPEVQVLGMPQIRAHVLSLQPRGDPVLILLRTPLQGFVECRDLIRSLGETVFSQPRDST